MMESLKKTTPYRSVNVMILTESQVPVVFSTIQVLLSRYSTSTAVKPVKPLVSILFIQSDDEGNDCDAQEPTVRSANLS